MPREFPRSRRVEEAIQRILSQALAGQVRDRRLEGMVVTDVRVSRDLGVASVYYASISGAAIGPDIAEAWRSASGFLRSLLARELRVRHVPELRFFPDETLARSRRLETLIDKAVGRAPPEQGEDTRINGES